VLVLVVGDFSNYVVISNNDFASLIEESDRRALCLETSNDMVGDRKYFNNYWKVLGNMDSMNGCGSCAVLAW
jgi:hypothetical protein